MSFVLQILEYPFCRIWRTGFPAGSYLRRDWSECWNRKSQEHAGGRRYRVPTTRDQIWQSDWRRADGAGGAKTWRNTQDRKCWAREAKVQDLSDEVAQDASRRAGSRSARCSGREAAQDQLTDRYHRDRWSTWDSRDAADEAEVFEEKEKRLVLKMFFYIRC